MQQCDIIFKYRGVLFERHPLGNNKRYYVSKGAEPYHVIPNAAEIWTPLIKCADEGLGAATIREIPDILIGCSNAILYSNITESSSRDIRSEIIKDIMSQKVQNPTTSFQTQRSEDMESPD